MEKDKGEREKVKTGRSSRLSLRLWAGSSAPDRIFFPFPHQEGQFPDDFGGHRARGSPPARSRAEFDHIRRYDLQASKGKDGAFKLPEGDPSRLRGP